MQPISKKQLRQFSLVSAGCARRFFPCNVTISGDNTRDISISIQSLKLNILRVLIKVKATQHRSTSVKRKKEQMRDVDVRQRRLQT